MGGQLCRLCGTEQPEQAPASPAADVGGESRAAEREEVIARLTLKVRELTERAEAAESHAGELEAMLTAPAAPAAPAEAPKPEPEEPKAAPKKKG